MIRPSPTRWRSGRSWTISTSARPRRRLPRPATSSACRSMTRGERSRFSRPDLSRAPWLHPTAGEVSAAREATAPSPALRAQEEGPTFGAHPPTASGRVQTDHPGYATGTASERYLHSVWTVHTDTGRCTIDVPLMSGHGGNHVMMLPSGLSVVRFMDANDYEVSHATRAAELIRSSCR
jgi:hypothetical protein